MAVDYSGEYKFWGNTEPITVHFKTSGSESVDLTHALRKGAAKRLTRGGNSMSLQSQHQNWWLPAALLTTHKLDVGDEIEDGEGTKWKIDSVSETRVGSSLSHYDCSTHKA